MNRIFGFALPLLLVAAAASAQGLPGPGGAPGGAPGDMGGPGGSAMAPAMPGAMAPAISGGSVSGGSMPGAPMAGPGGAMPGATPGGAMAPGMQSQVPGEITPGMAPALPTGKTASVSTTTTSGGTGVVTAFHGMVYQTIDAGDATEGFMTIQNQGGSADKLTALSCPLADSTTLTDAGGSTLSDLAIPVGKPVTLAPKGLHLALKGTHFKIYRGSVVPCELTFQNTGQIQVLLYAAKRP